MQLLTHIIFVLNLLKEVQRAVYILKKEGSF